MILIGIGANLPSRYGPPLETLKAAKQAMIEQGIIVLKCSHVWLTAPVPFDPDQDWFHNAVMDIETDLSAHDLLKNLQDIEENFGRVRSVPNAPRLLDLDLLAYNDAIIEDSKKLIVPHPRMHERLFVLKPLAEINAQWKHPVSGDVISEMLNNIPDTQEAKMLEDLW